jgi:hypothetical protein
MGRSRPLKKKEEVRAVTLKSDTLASRFRISSVIPSAKCSGSGSELIFTNGMTATEFSSRIVATASL